MRDVVRWRTIPPKMNRKLTSSSNKFSIPKIFFKIVEQERATKSQVRADDWFLQNLLPTQYALKVELCKLGHHRKSAKSFSEVYFLCGLAQPKNEFCTTIVIHCGIFWDIKSISNFLQWTQNVTQKSFLAQTSSVVFRHFSFVASPLVSILIWIWTHSVLLNSW